MKIKNRERLRKKIRRLPDATRDELVKALVASGQEINGLQKRFVPRDEGDLADTIGMIEHPEDLKVVLVAGGPKTTRPVREGVDLEYDYAFAQEFGTQEMPANPFFFPGYRLGKKRAKSRISRAITKAAKRVAGVA
jgi:hypothetical protein